MEKVILNMVKIIIIGSLFDKTAVLCNRQFLSMPPIPYHGIHPTGYPNEGYYVPDFAPPYQEPVPVYYPHEPIPHAPVYQDYYSPPQLFHQNKNYHPPQAPPEVNDRMQTLPYHVNPPQPTFMPPPVNMKLQGNYQSPPVKPKPNRPSIPEQKIKLHTNIIHKEENYPPFYHDEYNKNYHDEDYPDYSEDSSSQVNPCKMDSPYRFFEPIRIDPNNPLIPRPLCNPYLQPNVANAVYGLKTPITLLPSRFPPRVEQIIERIQNYFSTYTQQGQQNPQNQTIAIPSTTPPPTVSESVDASVPQAADFDTKNATSETPITFTASLKPLEVTTVVAPYNFEQVTEKPEIITIPSDEIQGKIASSTEATDVQNEKDTQVEVTTMPNEVTSEADVPMTTPFMVANENETVTEQSLLEIEPQPSSTENEIRLENTTEEQPVSYSENVTEKATESSVVFELETKVMGAELLSTSTESTEKETRTEDYSTISTTNEIFHNVADNKG